MEIYGTPAKSPVFLLGCSWRCGSTLLQRYINSTQRVFLWGEHAGLLASVPSAFVELKHLTSLASRQLELMQSRGTNAWVANITPSLDKYLIPALRSFLADLYESPTVASGIHRWGFKEVRYDAEMAALLLLLFPNARIVFLLRHPSAVLASNAVNDWYCSIGGAAGVVKQWMRSCASFQLMDDKRLLVVKYEDLIADEVTTTKALSQHLGIEYKLFSRDVLKHKVRGATRLPQLGPAEYQALQDSDLLTLMTQYGYTIRA